MSPTEAFLAGFVTCLALFIPLGLAWWLLGPWLKAFLAGGRVSIFAILGMRLRGTPVRLVLDAYLSFIQRNIPVTLRQVESTYIAQRHRIQSAGDLIRFVEEDLQAGQ